MDFLRELREANLRRQKEWDKDNSIDLSYRGNELAGEVGEACNVIKKLDREKRGIRGSRSTPEALAEELADVVICVDLIAAQFNLDLPTAVRQKFNATSRKLGFNTFIDCPVCGGGGGGGGPEVAGTDCHHSSEG